jgi:hypothetical protein
MNQTNAIMKKLFNKTTIILILALINMSYVDGQLDIPQSKIYSRESVKLNGETDVKEIRLPLRDSLSSINILIFSMIGGGELSVEIYDPTGVRYGNFSLSCQNDPELIKKITGGKVTIKEIDQSDGKAMGNLSKTVKNPTRGFWIAKVRSIGAIGTVQIQLGEQKIQEGMPIIYKIN